LLRLRSNHLLFDLKAHGRGSLLIMILSQGRS